MTPEAVDEFQNLFLRSDQMDLRQLVGSAVAAS
jgi:hypothetical protein